MCSYYPLFPPALGSFLDTSLGAALTLPVTPDVLLLPSNLAPFAKLAPVGAGEDGPKVWSHSNKWVPISSRTYFRMADAVLGCDAEQFRRLCR